MRRWAWAALPLWAACADPAVVDLGALTLPLWQPRSPDGQELDLTADAERTTVTVFVDGEPRPATFERGTPLRLEVPQAGVRRAEVAVVVETTGGAAGPAVARSETVVVEPLPAGGEAPRFLAAVLAPVDGRGHPLELAAPPALQHAAVCGAPDGRVFVVGGVVVGGDEGGWSGTAVHTVDPRAQAVVAATLDPAPLQRASCASDGDTLWVFGGCDLAEAAAARLLELDVTGPAPRPRTLGSFAGAGCGTAAALLEAGRVVLVVGDDATLDPPDGQPTARLPAPRFAPRVVTIGTTPLAVVVAGGTTTASGGAPVPGYDLVTWRPEGVEVLPVDVELAALGGGPGAAFAVVDRRLEGFAADGRRFVVVEAEDLGLDPGFTAGALAVLPDGRAAILDAAGRALVVADAHRRVDVVLDPPRPGAALFPDRGGALRVVGGGAGVDVVVLAD